MNFESEKTTWMRDSKKHWVSVIEVEKEMKETHKKAKDEKRREGEWFPFIWVHILAVTLTITWLLLAECIECRESQNESSGMFSNYPKMKEAKKP